MPVEWEHHTISSKAVTPGGDLISQEALDSVIRNGVGLKGPFATPIGKGHRSLNLTLRKALQLYANVRPCKSIPGLKTKYDDVDIVTIRENTEGEYTGERSAAASLQRRRPGFFASASPPRHGMRFRPHRPLFPTCQSFFQASSTSSFPALWRT